MQQSLWWQKAVFYQIYPRSFADGNGDGIGDFEGMLAKLDYLKWLGIDALWLSPHYPSPNADCGYDVSDYCAVAPEYGSLELFDRFLHAAHLRGMKVVLDMVLNHTSNEHNWFHESRSNLENPKRDWYIWHPGDGKGNPPNNWYSTFGGPAWELDPLTDQYYYHFFFKEQPDLNWRNPEVKAAMFGAVRFWLDKGVDGFRLDAVGTIFETPGLPNQRSRETQDSLFRLQHLAQTPIEQRKVVNTWQSMFRHQVDLPEVHDLMKELRRLVDTYQHTVLIGETEDIRFYGNQQDELHTVFNFPLMRTTRLTPSWVASNQKKRLTVLPEGAWPCNTLGNHDSPRIRNRYGDGLHDIEINKLNLALMLTLRGTPVLYNGEEIGMTDFTDFTKEQLRDSFSLFVYGLASRFSGISQIEALKIAIKEGRDKNRTPLQWSNEPNGGFSPDGVQTWLPVNPNFEREINVAEQMADPASLLNFYREFLVLRRSLPALQSGEYNLIAVRGNILAFRRFTDQQNLLIILHFGYMPQGFLLPPNLSERKIVYSNHHHTLGIISTRRVRLLPFEVLILEEKN
jgi:alpha-glucosidase